MSRRKPTEQELMDIAQRNGWPLSMVEELVRDSAISENVLKLARVEAIMSDYKAAAKRFGKTPKDWQGRLPAWCVPYYIPFQQDPVLVRAKPAKPFITKEKKADGSIVEKVQKYAQGRETGVHVLYGPSLLHGTAASDTSQPIVVTEGEKKTLACESAGVACIGLGGVSNWHVKGSRDLHPELQHITWDSRAVFICFDFDALYNDQVRQEELALGRAIQAKGAQVYIVRLTKDAPKLDDYLVTHEVSEFQELLQQARTHGALPADTSGAAGEPAFATALTDLGNAERFVKKFGDDLRYCEAIGAWYLWTGKRWERDTTQQIMRRAMATARSIYGEADAVTDPDYKQTVRNWAKASEAQARLSAMVKLSSVMRTIAIKPEAFDQDPWLINCENGTVDIRSCELRPHNRKDNITRVAPVVFDPNATHEVWERFLREVTGGDDEMISYLQCAVGYSLTGDTSEDKLFFIHGPGGRGKGTFVNAILNPLGEYARVADITSFLERRDPGGDKPRPDLVRLMGSRIVLCDEVKRDARLDEGLVKTITGGSPLSVRTLNKEGFEMVPSFKLWLVANDPPIIHAEDTGMWRRMVRIPFLNAPKAPDTGLRAMFKGDPAVRAAVFAWAVRGVALWLTKGLVEPQAILDSNAAYHAEMDPVGEFFQSQCKFVELEHGEHVAIGRKDLRAAYEGWCKDEGHQPVGARRFAARLKDSMRACGIASDHLRTTVRVWEGPENARVSVVRNGWKHVRLLTGDEKEAREGDKAPLDVDMETPPKQLVVTSVVPVVPSPPIAKIYERTNLRGTPSNSNSVVTTVTTVTTKEGNHREGQGVSDVVTSDPVATSDVTTDEESNQKDLKWEV